jgi:transposase
MQLRYSYRLDPQPRHRAALGKAFGCARVVFNDGLAARHQAHQAGQRYLTDAELSARLTAAKATPQRAWLTEVSAVVLQQALADLNTAYRNYFASLTGTRKGPKVGPPRFRSRKDTRQAIRFTANARFKVLPDGKLRLPKIGDVPARTRLAKSVHDAGWSAFVGMLEYKARLYGREFHRIGRFEPTSQTCSACGVKDGPKPLHVRAWQCPACRAWLDRDVNAAVNVAKAAGLAVTACGAQVRPGLALAQRGEAGTHPTSRRKAA